jgi:carbamoyl-phosphate synthase large subunit
MPRTIHILGAGQWQIPSIRLAKSLGYRVFVTDIYQERPGYALADDFEVVDITDAERTLRAAESRSIDGIVCDTTDVGVPTMAWVAEKLGLPGIRHETALNFTDKGRMRAITSAAGLPNPPFTVVRDAGQAKKALRDFGFPVVVKPTRNQSSRGVHVVRRPEALDEVLADAMSHSRGGELIVEGFLDGTEVTVESFCCDGKVYVAGISDKDHFAHRPEVANRLTYPADFPPAILARIEEVNRGVIEALGLKTGITHAEYMVVGTEVYLVEIAARGAGSRVYSHIVPYLAGAPVPKAYLQFAAGDGMSIQPDGGHRAANLAFFCFPPGRVRSIEGLEEARSMPGVEEVLLEFGPGDVLHPPQDDRSRPGLAVVFGRTRGEVLDTTQHVFDTVKVNVE